MTKRRTIAHIQKITGIGGTEQFFLQLGKGLTELGWNCKFGLLLEPENELPDYQNKLNAAGWDITPITIKHNISPRCFFKIRSWLKNYKPDLLHTHLIHGDLYGRLASLNLDHTLVTSKHNDDQFKNRPGYSIFAQLLNHGFDAGICISHHLKNFYENELKVRSLPFKTIHYGLDPDDFMDEVEPASLPGVPGDAFTFGIVARLTKQKGHEELLEAFQPIAHSRNVHLVIVGTGPLEESLRNKAEEIGVAPDVTFTGFRSDIPALLKRFDVFVHPSRWEGFGLVFLEAMAAKLPVIATNVSAIPEIVKDGVSGILVPRNNANKLSDAMEKLAANTSFATTLGQNGYKRLLDSFSVEDMINQHHTFYRQLLEPGNGGHE